MANKIINTYVGIVLISIICTACSVPVLLTKNESKTVPESYKNSQDSTNSANINWKTYFNDPNLVALIDTALKNNQELNITIQEIEIAKNEIQAKKGEYLPFVDAGGGMGIERPAKYTQIGSSEATTEIKPGKETPDPLPDFMLGAFATWEVDIWHKLRNAKKSAYLRYLASIEGKNFMVTNLVSEIAGSYYELLALDNQLAIVQQNIETQTNALSIVKLQKEAARVTELAVRRFEAQVLNTRSLQYSIQQRIIATENRINFLVGRFPQPVARSSDLFSTSSPGQVFSGLPSQLLANRPDIRQAEQELSAAKLDIQVARAGFYPTLRISAGLGYQAYNPALLFSTPASIFYNLGGEFIGPLVNRNAIKATYYNANARQTQAVYKYERTILNAYIEVTNQLANINNLAGSYDLKSQQVQALTQSINLANDLFRSARADYVEVLLTQRDALESRFDLVETKMQQLLAWVNVYRALGGGWN